LDKEIHTELRLELQVLYKQHSDKCCPNLYVKGILSGSDKGLDLQILFQGLEKQLNLPPIFIDGRDSRGPKSQVVSKENNLALFFLIPNHDSLRMEPGARGTFRAIVTSAAS